MHGAPGPALALAVGLIAREDPDALIASVHADHRVSDRDAYRAAVIASAGWAAGDRRACDRRARPGRPGDRLRIYRGGERRAPLASGARLKVVRPRSPRQRARSRRSNAAGFTEKPSAEVAQRYVAGGRHLWNLGLFAWTARRFRAELDRRRSRGRGRRSTGSSMPASAATMTWRPYLWGALGCRRSSRSCSNARARLTVVEAIVRVVGSRVLAGRPRCPCRGWRRRRGWQCRRRRRASRRRMGAR